MLRSKHELRKAAQRPQKEVVIGLKALLAQFRDEQSRPDIELDVALLTALQWIEEL